MANSGLTKMFQQRGVRTLFFGLGAQRSGSTWLHRLLSSHPDIYVPEQQKELHYWSKWSFPYSETGLNIFERQRPTGIPRNLLSALLRKDGIQQRRKTIVRGEFLEAWRVSLSDRDNTHSHYGRVLLSNWSKERVVGEITPLYALIDESGFREMDAQHSDVRFIYILRDPVDRFKSAISYFAARDLIKAQDRMFDKDGFLTTGIGKEYLRHSQYERTIQVLEAVIDPAKVHYCFFETMRLEREVERLCEFLSVDPSGVTLPAKVNASKQLRVPISEELVGEVRQALASTYSFCSAKFEELPGAWRDNIIKLQSGATAAR